MARRRLYLHPVRWTSLGLSLLEAMHLGMPVVALATTEVPRGGAARGRGGLDPGRGARRRGPAAGRRPRAGPADGQGRPGGRHRPLRARAVPGRLGRLLEEVGADEDRHGVRARQPAGRARRRRRRRAERARGRARRPRWPGAGAEVVVHTRRDDPDLPPTGRGGARGDRRARRRRAGRAGPQGRPAAATWTSSRDRLRGRPGTTRPTWSTPTSGCRAGPPWPPARPLGIPVVQTFHALGVVKRRHQGAEGHQPAEPAAGRGDAGQGGRPDRRHLLGRGLRAGQDGRRPAPGHGGALRGRPRACSGPTARPAPRPAAGTACWWSAGWSSARASAT